MTKINHVFFIFNTRKLSVNSLNLNLSGTNPEEISTRPPNCTAPPQTTIHLLRVLTHECLSTQKGGGGELSYTPLSHSVLSDKAFIDFGNRKTDIFSDPEI